MKAKIGFRRRLRVIGPSLAGLLTALNYSGTALAAEETDKSLPPPTATAAAAPAIFGDWGGLRTKAADAGIDLTATYVLEAAANPVGGDRLGVAQAGELALAATVDTAKLIGLGGGTLQFTVTERQGNNLSADRHLDTLTQVQQIYGRGNVVRLTELSYDQKLFAGALQVKFGRASEAVDFAVASCDQQNLALCGAQPGIAVAGDYWFNTPVAPLMARLRANLSAAQFVQVGVYDVNPRLPLGSGALQFGIARGSTGTLFPAEAGWTPRFGGTLPGRWVIGGWYYTGNGMDVLLDGAGLPLALTGAPAAVRHGRYGGYLSVQQQLTHPQRAPPGADKLGWSIYVDVTQGDDATSVVDNAIRAGLKLTGTFPGRDQDEVAIAVARNHVNSRLADSELIARMSGAFTTAVQHAEYVAELYYACEAVRGLSVRPNVQLIHDPGGITSNPDIVVLGLNVLANF